ncbi:hypothetical protein BOTBODRAFT_178535 [Botryobasidium botryosum FD-172 SS1]|uniref:Uncharacterized protein n=1 Tax=Botryobasidium botryosum (strain FD-172 SS1) TaxID=930990 RepID=A0A067MDM1_BOTB1|nr:hypothetical protein BOTBODRAFT_178535 [Botryobasidium botryosum FD-172 SS1]
MLDKGISPELIVLDKRVATMRDRSVRWVVEPAHKALSNKDIVKKAWELCKVDQGRFNLSYESLTSKEARDRLLQLRTEDRERYIQLTMDDAPIPATDDPFQNEDEAALYNNDDDSNQDVNDVISSMLSGTTPSLQGPMDLDHDGDGDDAVAPETESGDDSSEDEMDTGLAAGDTDFVPPKVNMQGLEPHARASRVRRPNSRYAWWDAA